MSVTAKGNNPFRSCWNVSTDQFSPFIRWTAPESTRMTMMTAWLLGTVGVTQSGKANAVCQGSLFGHQTIEYRGLKFLTGRGSFELQSTWLSSNTQIRNPATFGNSDSVVDDAFREWLLDTVLQYDYAILSGISGMTALARRVSLEFPTLTAECNLSAMPTVEVHKPTRLKISRM